VWRRIRQRRSLCRRSPDRGRNQRTVKIASAMATTQYRGRIKSSSAGMTRVIQNSAPAIARPIAQNQRRPLGLRPRSSGDGTIGFPR
jgi:hypothetical protein